VRFSGISGSGESSVIARTTTTVPEGRAGLAYPAGGVPERVDDDCLSLRAAPQRYRPLERRVPESGWGQRREHRDPCDRLFRGMLQLQ
jgi:hypothetical protein